MNKNDSKNISGTNWEALATMSDDNIDYSDIPPLTDEFFERATLRIPGAQAQNLVHLAPDVMKWFQHQGEYLTFDSTSGGGRYDIPLHKHE